MFMNNLKAISFEFYNELNNSFLSKKSSLPFIRHRLAARSIVLNDEVFQVIVIGGSIYQKALMKKRMGQIEILSYDKGTQPVFDSEKTLMQFLSANIDKNVSKLALNFAYPLSPMLRNGLMDGQLMNGSKENTFTGLVGKVVGNSIEEYFEHLHNRKLTVTLANDTICLLLSGLMKYSWDQLAAGIVGTGLNFAIFLDKNSVVNLESAEFDKFKQSDEGIVIDKNSLAPGSALIEKEVSGAYLYHHFNLKAQKLGLNIDKISSTKEIDNLIGSTDPKISNLALEILEYSASLVAAQIAGILDFCKRDLVFIMQGSLYWKGHRYKETIDNFVKKLSPNYQATYIDLNQSDLFGAAKLIV